MIESVPAYHQVGELVQQGKILGAHGKVDGSVADRIVHQHSEFLIDIKERIDGNFDGCRKGNQVTGAATADGHDRLTFHPY